MLGPPFANIPRVHVVSLDCYVGFIISAISRPYQGNTNFFINCFVILCDQVKQLLNVCCTLKNQSHAHLRRIDPNPTFVVDIALLSPLRWVYQKMAMEKACPSPFKTRLKASFLSHLIKSCPVREAQHGCICV